MKLNKYHYVYKITTLIDNKFYIGKHSTNFLDDNYYGSGIIIQKYIKKYGKDILKKEILKIFNTSSEAYEYEKKLVDENMLKNPNCLNLRKGGLGFNNYSDENFSKLTSEKFKNTVVVKDKNNNFFRVKCDDERIKTGELIYANKGITRSKSVKEKLSKIHKELCKNPTEKMINSWKQNGLNKIGKPHKLSEEARKNIIKNNKKPKSENTINKLSNKVHICKLENNISYHKFIDKDKIDEYLLNGWILGMYPIKRVFIHKKENDKIICNKRIPENELEKYLNEGWIRGRGICTFNILDENGHMKQNQINKRKNRIHIYKIDGNILLRKLIKNEELENYLNNGWKKGRIKELPKEK